MIQNGKFVQVIYKKVIYIRKVLLERSFPQELPGFERGEEGKTGGLFLRQNSPVK